MPDTVKLFNKVAEHYDALNTFFSLGMDRLLEKTAFGSDQRGGDRFSILRRGQGRWP